MFFAGPCVTDYTAWNSSACMPDETVQVRKTASFFEFSLCLSRACLGKMIVFIYKWLKNAVFRREVMRLTLMLNGIETSFERLGTDNFPAAIQLPPLPSPRGLLADLPWYTTRK